MEFNYVCPQLIKKNNYMKVAQSTITNFYYSVRSHVQNNFNFKTGDQ